MAENKSPAKSPITAAFEIGRAAQEIRRYLETVAANGLGKIIYVTRQIKDNSPPPDDTLSPLERLNNPPPPQIERELGGIALPLSQEEKSPWLIIIRDGNFIRVDPPGDENFFSRFKNLFVDLDVIEVPEEEFNLTNPYKKFLSILWPGSIRYNTATNYPSDETEAQIEEDFNQALQIVAKIREERLKTQRKRQDMVLKKLREFFNLSSEEEIN